MHIKQSHHFPTVVQDRVRAGGEEGGAGRAAEGEGGQHNQQHNLRRVPVHLARIVRAAQDHFHRASRLPGSFSFVLA